MEDIPTTSAKLYFIVFLLGLASSASINKDNQSSGNETLDETGTSHLTGNIIAEGTGAGFQVSAGGFQNSYNSLSHGIEATFSGGVTGWAGGTGGSISGSFEGQVSNNENIEAIITQDNAGSNAPEVQLNTDITAGSQASSIVSVSAVSESESSPSAININTGVSTADNGYGYFPPPPYLTAHSFANSNTYVQAQGEHVSATLTMTDIVKPNHAEATAETSVEEIPEAK